jgi:hypothetical protein
VTTSPVMVWLAEGVPITLLCDLATTRDPESQTINLNERPADDALLAEAVLLIGRHAAAATA